MPAMGDDGADYTAGYMNLGEVPTFKIYDASEDAYYNVELSHTVCYIQYVLQC